MNSKRKISQKRSILVGALVLSQAFYLTPLPVSAQDATVRLAGQAVITNVSTAGALTGAQRAETIQQNLDNALVASKDRSPNAVNIEYVKGLPVITLGGYQVITVDSASAKTAGTTPALLAQRWADALKGALQDQASVSSYVGHLTGEYQGGSSSPAPAPAPAPQQQAYQGSAYQSGYPQGAPQTPSYGAGANVGYNQGAPYNGGANAGYPQGGAPYNGGANYNPGYNPPPPGYRHGRVVYAPAGTRLNATLLPRSHLR
ncbi:MAG: hypothetical protein R3D26_09420 [Cyanobacteriota/Melainabacteria group bacterium]